MNKRYIPGVIVVEGIHDVAKISLLYDGCFVVTNGYEIVKEEKDFLIHLPGDVRVIILTDDDEAGEKIRKELNEIKANAINVRIKAPQESKKKGVAECDIKDIQNSLDIYSVEQVDFVDVDLYSLGIKGRSNSSKVMEHISKTFHLGKCSYKNIVKRINLLHIKIEDIIKEIEYAFGR